MCWFHLIYGDSVPGAISVTDNGLFSSGGHRVWSFIQWLEWGFSVVHMNQGLGGKIEGHQCGRWIAITT